MNKTNYTDSINPVTNPVKTAAIYCRVSTENQEMDGTSLDTQREACLKYCQEHDLTVTNQFRETYSGLTIERPELDRLRQLIRNQEINVVIVYSLDRLTRDPNHGVILRQERERYDVTLEAVTETVDSSKIGQLIEYIYGYAANLEAEKIRERTQRGIRSRVFDKKKPVTYRRAPYGYSWDQDNNQLVPDSNYDTAKLILDSAIGGKSYDWIIAELKNRGILSPSGLPYWNKHTVSMIIRNPVYFGKYHAFKSEAVKPKNGNGKSRKVKSSVKRLPPEQWHYIPEIEVVKPPITQAQHTLLIDQLQQRQKLASRNAKREYLLRGMIFCETHKGVNGEPRRYHGTPKHGTYYYACPEGGCDTPLIPGEICDEWAKSFISLYFFFNNESVNNKYKKGNNSDLTEASLNQELKKLRNEYNQLSAKLATLEEKNLNKEIDIDAYDLLKAKYNQRRQWIKQRENELLDQISIIRQGIELKNRFDKTLQRFMWKVNYMLEPEGPSLSFNEWREILTSIGFEMHVYPNKTKNIGSLPLGTKGDRKIKVDLRAKLPIDIDTEFINNIGKHVPANGLRNQQYYPIRFTTSDFNINDLIKVGGGGGG